MKLCVFSTPDNEFYDFINSRKETIEILDFSNLVDWHKTRHTVTTRNGLPSFYTLQKEAVERYLIFCRELSRIRLDGKTSIRDIRILGLPVYWITAISEKHPRYHWGLSFFYMLTYLRKTEEKESVIYLPNSLSGLEKTLSSFSKQNNLCFTYLINGKKKNERFKIKRFVGLIIRYVLLLTWRRPRTFSKENSASINLITHTGGDLVIKNYFESFARKGNVELCVFPIDLPLNQKSQKHLHVSKTFWKSKPGLIGLCKVFADSFRAYRKVGTIEDGELIVSGFIIPVSVVKNEMADAIHVSLDKIIVYAWYSNFFKKHSGVFFLQDEFYIPGRVITQAKRCSYNDKVTIKGIQHGMFSETHTVYNISLEEIEALSDKEDGLPVPDKFVVWGNHFKNLFLRTGAFNKDYVAASGSLKYLDLLEMNDIICEENRLLWCLTASEQFKHEFLFIKEMLRCRPELKLSIRRHPRVPVAIEDIEKLMLSHQIGFTYDTNVSILNSIKQAALVVTSSHSTVFLDAAVLKVPVIRVVYDRKDDDTAIVIPYVFVANEIADIRRIVDEIQNRTNENSIEQFLYPKLDRWYEEINEK